MTIDLRFQIHEEHVANLKDRLLNKPYVSEVLENLEYKQGQIDLLVRTERGWTPYEIKSTHSYKAHSKAKDQIRRAIRCSGDMYPATTDWGVYWTPTFVEIMRYNK